MKVKKINPDYANFVYDPYAPIGMQGKEPAKYIYVDVPFFSKDGLKQAISDFVVLLLAFLAASSVPFNILLLVFYSIVGLSLGTSLIAAAVTTVIAIGTYVAVA